MQILKRHPFLSLTGLTALVLLVGLVFGNPFTASPNAGPPTIGSWTFESCGEEPGPWRISVDEAGMEFVAPNGSVARHGLRITRLEAARAEFLVSPPHVAAGERIVLTNGRRGKVTLTAQGRTTEGIPSQP